MTLAKNAYDLIRAEIINCSLAPGQLIAQAQLVEKYGLGLTPVREALQRLTHEGLVESYPRFGYLVSPVTEDRVRHLFEYRLILETAVTRLAALRGADEPLGQLVESAHFTYIYHNREEYVRFLEQNAQFHNTVARLSGNPRLARAVAGLLDELTRVFHLGLDLRDSADEMQTEHILLATALQARDANRAEQLSYAQIVQSQQRVLEALRNFKVPFA